jgi:uncharacterized protein YuzE
MEVRYHPGPDVLHVRFATAKSVESEEVQEGFILSFDESDKVVSLEVLNASRRVNLELIERDPAVVVPEGQSPEKLYTDKELAEEVGLSKRGLSMVVEKMRSSGQKVGLRDDLAVFTAEDLRNVRQWRNEHPRGAPPKLSRA